MEFLFDRQRNKYTLPMKVLSVILVFIMAFSGGIISCYAMGAGVPEKLEMESILSKYIKDVVDLNGVKSIDTEKSTDTELYFNLKDDSTIVYTFSEPVTYIDEDGNLRCKDNNIIKQNNKENKDLGYDYSNNQNDYRINLSTDSSKGFLVEYGDVSFSIAPLSDNSVNGRISKGKTEFEYIDLLGENTLLKYFLQINGIKEEIILNAKADTNIFKSSFKTEGCIPIINDDGSISLISRKTGKEVQNFVAPFAFDSEYVAGIADEHFCADCTYEIEKVADNEYILSVTVSEDWLNSDTTVYPVTIDPTTSNIYNYADASVYSADPSKNYGSDQTCGFGYDSEHGYGRVYTRFTVPSDIKKYALIQSAELWESELTGATSITTVTPYIVTASWTETSIKWENMPAYDPESAMETKIIDGDSTDDPYDSNMYSFNIKSAVEKWVDGTANYGLVFISEAESNNRNTWRAFAAQNYIASDYRPFTVIKYTNDTRAPKVTAVTGNPTEWTNSNVTLTAVATDDVFSVVSGIKSYSFSTNENDFVEQTSPSKTVTANATYYIRAKDNAGNISTAVVVKVSKIDQTKPTTPSISGVPTSRVNDDIVITATSTDTISGVSDYSFSTESGVYNWQKENTKTITDNGTYYVCTRDYAGNVSDVTTVNVNKIVRGKPSDPVITGNVTDWTNDDVTLTAVPTDEESKVIEYSFSTDLNTYSWQSEPYKAFSENCTVYPAFKDSDGEISAADPVVINKIDKTLPDTPTIKAEYEENKVTLTVTSSDSQSGLAGYSFSTEEGVYDWQESNTKEFTENTCVYVYARDVAGNISLAKVKKIYLDDITAPTFTDVTGNATEWTKSDVILTVNGAEDSETGLHEKAYSFTTSSTSYSWQAENSKAITSNQTVYISVRDEAGNIALVDTVVVNRIDKSAPSISSYNSSDNGDTTTFTINATDSLSGIAGYSIDGGKTWSESNAITFEKDKYNYIDFRVKDNAGNVSSKRIYNYYTPKAYKENGKIVLYNPNPKCNSEIYYRTSKVIFTTWKTYSEPFTTTNSTIYVTFVEPESSLSLSVDYAVEMKVSSIPSLSSSYVAGKYEESNTEASLSYKGVTFDFVRTYDNSKNDWFFSVDSVLTLDKSNNRITAVFPDNSKHIFLPKNVNTYYDLRNDYIVSVERDSDGNILSYRIDIDGIYYNYDSTGILSSVTNKNGNTITITRYTDKIVVADGANRTYTLNLNTNKNIVSITDPAGGIINYTYDSNGKLVKVVDQADVILDTYSYDENGLIIKNNDTSILYDSQARVTSKLYDSGAYTNYIYNGNVVTSETSTGKESSTKYNSYGNVLYIIDENGNKTTYTYDNKNHVLTQETGEEGEDRYSYTLYQYNSNGKLLNVYSDPKKKNLIESYSYDSFGNLIREYKNKNYTYYVYNKIGEVILSATLKEDYTGSIPTKYDDSLECFNTIEYEYADGLIMNLIDRTTNSTVNYEYDIYGNNVKSINTVTEDGSISISIIENSYDVLGRILNHIASDTTSTYIYDAAGRVLFTNLNGICSRMLYDQLGRLVQIISGEDYDQSKDGLPNSNTYDDSSAGIVYVYNEKNQIESEKNQFGKTIKYIYNEIGLKTGEEYDIYKFHYLPHGELSQVDIDDEVKITYTYDDNYNLATVAYANGDRIRYEYDENNNIIAEYHNNYSDPYVTYTYSDDTLSEKVNTDTGLRYVYGENDNINVYRLSDNVLVQSYTETELGDERTIVESHFGNEFCYIENDGEVSFLFNDQTITFCDSVDEEKNILSSVVLNNGVTAISSDSSYEDEKIVSKSYSLSDNQILNYFNEYDSSGKIVANGINEITNYYAYDQNDQIIRADILDVDSTYVFIYDERGNIVSKEEYAYTTDDSITTKIKNHTEYTYENTGWIDRVISINDVEVKYDENGNIISYGDRLYTWNSGRQLESITIAGSESFSYTYNENGIRTSKTVNGITTYFNTDNGKVLSQTDGTNTMYFQYYYGELVGFLYNEKQYFYLTNQMGDIVGITDADGNLIAEYIYDVQGKCEIIKTAKENDANQFEIANSNPMRYRGYYYDSETEYYYLQSHYYDPNIGRFINSNDLKTAKYADCTSVNSNLFVYCNNNPVNDSDIVVFNGLAGTWNTTFNPDIIIYLSGLITEVLLVIEGLKASLASLLATWEVPILNICMAIVCVILVVIVVQQFIALEEKATEIVDIVNEAVRKKGVTSSQFKDNSVYVITDKENDNEVTYIGRTSNFKARQTAHQRLYNPKYGGIRFPMSRYTMLVVATGLTLAESKALEEALIVAFTLDALQNAIHSIGEWNYDKFEDEFERMGQLIECGFNLE